MPLPTWVASSADFAAGPLQDVQGDFELDNIMFEAGALYLVNEAKRCAVIGGLRTYTLAPKIAFTGSLAGYKALGIDVEGESNDLRQYDVTHHGPIIGSRFH